MFAMRTATSTDPFVCSECGHTSEAIYYDVVDAVEDPAAKEKVLSGEAFTHTCPSCGAIYTLDYPMLYIDGDCRCMVYCAGGCEVGENVDTIFDSFADLEDAEQESPSALLTNRAGVRRRIVPTPEALMEKLDIFYAGLDDRIVELLKVSTMSALEVEHNTPVEWMMFDRVEPETGELVYVARSDSFEEGLSDIDVNRSYYDEIASDGELIDALNTVPYDFYVDVPWAIEVFSADMSEEIAEAAEGQDADQSKA